MKDQTLLKHLRKCIQEYGLIHEGDRIAVGISGGKDSMVLITGLRMLQKFYPERFELLGIIIDPGFSMDYAPIEAYFERIGVPLVIERTDIARIVFDARKEPHPCSLCSNMRRAALTEAAEREKCGVLALGHHKDDYLSTLLLSLVYEGKFYTYAPLTEYEDRAIRIIRPLLYVPEAAIGHYATEHGIPTVKNRCPADGLTKRQEMQELLEELQKRYPKLKDRLLHAVQDSDIPDWKNIRPQIRKDTIHA